MKKFQEILYNEGEYSYPVTEFVPTMNAYLHEDEEIRPAIVITPGGGYSVVSPTEGEIVALKFYELGYQTFVVTYTTDMFGQSPLRWQPLQDIARAVRMVRKHAVEYKTNPDQVAICGFSAGGHLCGSLAVHYDRPEIAPEGEPSARPDAAILCYPVITSGEFAHKDSFTKLFGKEATVEELELMSLEKQVKPETPPVFLWQTMTDELVPVENSIMFAQSCKAQGVMCEMHLYPEGKHGMSLANEAWARGEFGDGIYTMRQMYSSFKMLAKYSPEQLPEAMRDIEAIPFEAFAQNIEKMMAGANAIPSISDADIAKWPNLADAFLKRAYQK